MATTDKLIPPIDDIPKIVSNLHSSFHSSPGYRSVKSIKNELKNFRKNFVKSKELLASALLRDFHRSPQETYVAEYGPTVSELNYFINNLDSLLKPDEPMFTSFSFSTAAQQVEKVPLGVILIIVPFNYPILLSLVPLIGALATGNSVVLKLPYDQTPSCSEVLTNVLINSFPSNKLAVINGGLESSQLLITLKYDKIFFTGSERVGLLIAAEAAKTLTPVVLELGGKSPVFITSNCKSLETSIRRLFWGKFTNAGQTCVAPDYLLVEDNIYDEVISSILKEYKLLFKDINEDTDFTHIVDTRSFDRLTGYLETTKGRIILGGQSKASSKFIAPTVVTDVTFEDSLMKDELFGPILPIIKYSSLKSILETVRIEHDTPLAMYIFSNNKKEQELIKDSINSGAVCINETIMHAGCGSLPFGGIGTSGTGNYHGAYSISTFTHERAILKQPFWTESIIKSRYFPYNESKIKQLLMLVDFPDVPLRPYFWSFAKYTFVFAIGILIGWLI